MRDAISRECLGHRRIFPRRSDFPLLFESDPHVSLAAILQQRLLRIHEQIQHHLLQLVRVRHRFPQVRGEIAFHQDVLDSQFIAAQRQGALHDFVQVHPRALGLIFRAKYRRFLTIRRARPAS